MYRFAQDMIHLVPLRFLSLTVHQQILIELLSTPHRSSTIIVDNRKNGETTTAGDYSFTTIFPYEDEVQLSFPLLWKVTVVAASGFMVLMLVLVTGCVVIFDCLHRHRSKDLIPYKDK